MRRRQLSGCLSICLSFSLSLSVGAFCPYLIVVIQQSIIRFALFFLNDQSMLFLRLYFSAYQGSFLPQSKLDRLHLSDVPSNWVSSFLSTSPCISKVCSLLCPLFVVHVYDPCRTTSHISVLSSVSSDFFINPF